MTDHPTSFRHFGPATDRPVTADRRAARRDRELATTNAAHELAAAEPRWVTNLTLLRQLGSRLISERPSATPQERLGLLMRVRAIQDQIAGIRHKHATPPPPSDLDWVDTWRGDD